jgi:hypothetical protein
LLGSANLLALARNAPVQHQVCSEFEFAVGAEAAGGRDRQVEFLFSLIEASELDQDLGDTSL